MNWLTFLLLAVLGLLTYRAYRNGFVRELVSLCTLILAIPLAGVLYDDMYPKVQPIVDDELLARLVSFLAILTGVVIAGQVAAHLLKRTVELLDLGGADQIAGAAFGFLKGVLLCQVILIAFVAFHKPDLRDDIDGSALARRLLDASPVVLAILPGRFDDALDSFLDGTASFAFPGGTLTGAAAPDSVQ